MVPVVVLTGFLGAGKTTLLNALLARRSARGATGRVALVVNELGAVGIDGSLLPADATKQVELPGGCVCCVLNDDLDRSMIALVEDNAARGTPLEAIVIETTGVAEPLPIAWAIEREPLARVVRLAAVVTLVDATGFVEARPLSPAVDAQVEHADVLVLTKREIASDAERAKREATELNPRAPWVEGATEEVARWLDELLEDPPIAEPRDHDHDHDHAGHGIDSVWVEIEGILDLEELIDALEELPPSYVRVKGIARAVDGRTGSGQVHYVAFHRVGLRVSTEPLAWAAPTRAVALGTGVSAGALRACVERAVLSSTAGRGAD
ncbi:MAG TPA: GTP-binding protein [Kofleriaceae bacterium]|nr:GTP-binding protein [Kofleriaceae bacterium]